MVLNCVQMVQKLAAYFEGEMDASEKALIQRHLRGCANCRLVADSALETLSSYSQPEFRTPASSTKPPRFVVH
jgi:predicted anti-sigma-YlaC factor YlaD